MHPMLRVCIQFRPGMGACCADCGSAALLVALRAEVARRGVDLPTAERWLRPNLD